MLQCVNRPKQARYEKMLQCVNRPERKKKVRGSISVSK